ncbi:MAG: S-layer homology domain-containing protein [Actinomycetota bacterium]
MKKAALLGVMLPAALVAAFAVGPRAQAVGISGSFTDDDGSIHEPDINAISAAGITAGCGPGLYCPPNPVTRAEMATFLTRALKLTPMTTGPFTDIGGIHASNINAIAAAGITAGCGPGLYCPTSPVSRDQMATFLVRALGLAPSSNTPFSDIAGNPHAADIAAVAAAGITSGCGGGRYCPTNPVTREQMATFLARGFKLDRIYPQIPLVEGIWPSCSKDGLVCQASITVPYRGTFEVREGFYDTTAGASLASGSTRVELAINGNSVSMSALSITSAGSTRSRSYRATFTLAPGTHGLTARWYWNGYLEQTTTVWVTVRA